MLQRRADLHLDGYAVHAHDDMHCAVSVARPLPPVDDARLAWVSGKAPDHLTDQYILLVPFDGSDDPDARDVLHPGERHALLAPELLDGGLRRLRAVGDVQRTVHTESVGQAVKPWPGVSQGLSVAGDQLLQQEEVIIGNHAGGRDPDTKPPDPLARHRQW